LGYREQLSMGFSFQTPYFYSSKLFPKMTEISNKLLTFQYNVQGSYGPVHITFNGCQANAP